MRLFQVGHGRQIELAGRDESSAAPVGAEPTRINAGEVAREPRRVVAGESVAVTLAVVRVVVPKVEREHALGDADADVPGGVVRIWQGASGSGDLGAEEVIGCAQEPVAGFTGQVKSPALRHGATRRRELCAKRYIDAGGALIEHRRRVEHGPVVCDLIIHRECALGVALHEAQGMTLPLIGRYPFARQSRPNTGAVLPLKHCPPGYQQYQTPKSSASGPKVGRNPPKMSTSAAARFGNEMLSPEMPT